MMLCTQKRKNPFYHSRMFHKCSAASFFSEVFLCSCQYGDRCKFLHTTLQQPKPSTFGFGVQNTSPFLGINQQSQQQKPNPFGFGVQSASQSIGNHSPTQPQVTVAYFHKRLVPLHVTSPSLFWNFTLFPLVQPFINKWTRSSAAASTKPSKQGDAQPQGAHQWVQCSSNGSLW